MGRNRVITTRVSPEAYKKMLQKCADGGCSPYEYYRNLVYSDVGLNVEGVDIDKVVPADENPIVEEEPVPEEEEKEDERDNIEKRYKIVG